MVAGGSLRAVEAILRGDVEHAFHPGGGLHHAMPDRASGFCIYDDPALAIARARRDGLRVLYVDLDVHHGDGVQAIHWDDPGVLTVSFHESGRYLFPGTGGVGELGEGVAAGTSVNVPLEPGTGEGAWLAAVRGAAPRAGRRVRAGPHRVAARRRLARLGSARAPARDHDRDGRGRPARRPARAPVRRRSLAGDRRRRLRRVPGRAADLEPGLAGRRASRGAGRDAGRVARALGGRGRRGTARRRCPRPSTTPRTPGSSWTPRRPSPRRARSRRSALVRRLVVPRLSAGGARPRVVGSAGGRFRARLRRTAPTPGVGPPAILHPSTPRPGSGSRSRRGSSRRPTRSPDRPSSLRGDPRRRGRLGRGRRDAGRRARGRRPHRRPRAARDPRARRRAGVPPARAGDGAARGLVIERPPGRHRRHSRGHARRARPSRAARRGLRAAIARRLLSERASRSVRPTRISATPTQVLSAPFGRRSATRTQADGPRERRAAAAAASAAGCHTRLVRVVPWLMLDFGPQRRPSYSLCPWTAYLARWSAGRGQRR